MSICSKALADRIKVSSFSYFIEPNSLCRRKIYQQRWKTFFRSLQVTDFLNIRGLVVTVDIQKAFDSVNHLFLITALKKFGFGETFIKWMQILLRNQESCIINSGTTTK